MYVACHQRTMMMAKRLCDYKTIFKQLLVNCRHLTQDAIYRPSGCAVCVCVRVCSIWCGKCGSPAHADEDLVAPNPEDGRGGIRRVLTEYWHRANASKQKASECILQRRMCSALGELGNSRNRVRHHAFFGVPQMWPRFVLPIIRTFWMAFEMVASVWMN